MDATQWIKKHLVQCLKDSPEDEVRDAVGNCVLKAQVMAGFITAEASTVMREEVLPAMKIDLVRHVAMNDVGGKLAKKECGQFRKKEVLCKPTHETCF